MATLTDTNINDTYQGLLKTSDNNTITSLTRITDGDGCNTSISVNCGNTGASTGLQVHGDLIFGSVCGFNFPSSDGSNNQILATNGSGTIQFVNAETTLPQQSAFSTIGGGLSAFENPTSITVNDKGVVTRVSSSESTEGICSYTPALFCVTGNLECFHSNIPNNGGIRIVKADRANFNVDIDVKNTACLGRVCNGSFTTDAVNLANSNNFNFAILSIVNDKSSPDSGNVNSYIAGRKWDGSSSFGVEYTIAGAESSGSGDRISYVNTTFVPICNNRYFNVCSQRIGNEQVSIDLIGFA